MSSDDQESPFPSFNPTNRRPPWLNDSQGSTQFSGHTATGYPQQDDSQQHQYYLEPPESNQPQYNAPANLENLYYRSHPNPSQSSPIRYPESSQRTLLDDGRFPTEYNFPPRGVAPRTSMTNSELRASRERPTIHTGHRSLQPNTHPQMGLVPGLSMIDRTRQPLPSIYGSGLGNVDNRHLSPTASSSHRESLSGHDRMDYGLSDYPSMTTPAKSSGSNPPPRLMGHQPPLRLSYQMDPNSMRSRENHGMQTPLVSPSGYSDDIEGSYDPRNDPSEYLLHPPNISNHPSPNSPIPMCIRPEQQRSSLNSASSLSNAYSAGPPGLDQLPSEHPNSPPPSSTPDSEVSVSVYPAESYAGGNYLPSHDSSQAHFSSAVASSSSVPVKKKSKMHECDICHKTFPRPSGLKTHMNTHNGLKPYACDFPNCTRRFAVRSNAKRHLRTHGIIPTPVSESVPVPYVVGFSTPMVSPDAVPLEQQLNGPPQTFRWVPHNLSSRADAERPRPASDPESGAEDDSNVFLDPALLPSSSVPLRPVVSSSPQAQSQDVSVIDPFLETSDAYLETREQSYNNQNQYRTLPRPRPRSVSPL